MGYYLEFEKSQGNPDFFFFSPDQKPRTQIDSGSQFSSSSLPQLRGENY
jgi:hypothetical protein